MTVGPRGAAVEASVEAGDNSFNNAVALEEYLVIVGAGYDVVGVGWVYCDA